MRGFFSWQFFRFIFLSLLLLTVEFSVYSQPTDPAGDPDIPISGIEILLAAGALFGVKKLLGRGRKS